MLYTFSLADYPNQQLQDYFAEMDEKDAVLLWQDGVLLAVKYPSLFAQCRAMCLCLEQDIIARNLTALLPTESKVRSISMADFVEISERYFPQVAL